MKKQVLKLLNAWTSAYTYRFFQLLMPTYVITGASSGIGRELVKQLAARGEKVFATCRRRESSSSGVDTISEVPGDVTVLEGIDVARDDVGVALAESALSGVTIDVVVHNAGSYDGARDLKGSELIDSQNLENLTMDSMRRAFEVNTLGPLRVQQALNSQMAPGGKIAIISTGLASIDDNTSGGKYAYRTSKAGVNMVSKSLSCDLKEKKIAVVAIAPGFVVTEFVGADLAKWGATPVDQAVRGVLQAVDQLTLESTGSFVMVPSSGDAPKPMPW
ncbi:hypothetical protein CYMTET_23030 [Cymbomonas tetramitiformis]|uniref:Uncharacterized protein n=1 Tax=Cymbomonas tetramitiformis TaxID=36881 RepID=A0AAE0L1C4_9CHLO|nr:hypothetical protein CYMTET_23030 [Cymbomonas tetramitiformis]